MRVLADFREVIAEQIEYRELLFQMTLRDLLLRYKQTAMGFAWAVFMPLVNTLVFSVIFMRVAPLETPVAYPLFVFCGLWAWNFFASAQRFAVNSLTSNAGLVSKIYFPREIFPFSSVAVCFVDFVLGGVVLACFMLYFQVGVGIHLLWLPLVVAVQLVLTTAVSLLLSMANLFYRDVKYLFEIAITAWMFATPVVYSADTIDGRLWVAIQLNPMTPIVEAYRSVLLMNAAPSLPFALVSLFSLALLVVGWVFFHRMEFAFAENV